MKIALTSDLHGNLPVIPECDLLLIAGDVTPVWKHSIEFQWDWLENDFNNWLKEVPAEHIVGIAGNHDFIAEQYPYVLDGLNWRYLQDETIQIPEKYGFKIHGSPWTPQFFNWAFMKEDEDLAEKWALIPDDVDILLTHGPPFGICDLTLEQVHAGSKTLMERIKHLPKLKIHLFGHIHEAYGKDRITLYNASLVNRDYEPVNPVMVVEL